MSICYPPGADWSCKFSDTELGDMRGDPDAAALLERAEAFAWSLLAAMTAYRVGTCPITVRPCAARCTPADSFLTAPVTAGGGLVSLRTGMMSPYISGGRWYNACACRRANDCSCSALSEVLLPGPVGRIESVMVDGVELPRSAYRVDNGGRLVRLDGESWPSCQDMSLPQDAEGAFAVTYYRGTAPNAMVRAAAGAIAAEFYAACQGEACRLPLNLVSMSRQGESYEFEDGLDGALEGIPEVAAVIRIYNPYGLKSQPAVYSPDMPTTRARTA